MPAKKEKEEEVVVEEVVKEETVVVSKADLEGFLKRLDEVEDKNKKLMAVADKGRLASEREKSVAADGQPLIRTVKLTRLDSLNGKLVIAWKMLKNESFMEGNRTVANQIIEVYFQDGKTEEMKILDFYRRQNKETVAEIIKRSLNEKTGETEVEVELKDGERISVGLAFVN
jgi:hypothetical protein